MSRLLLFSLVLLAVIGCKREVLTAHGKTADEWHEEMTSMDNKPSVRAEAMSNVAMIAGEPSGEDAVILLADGLKDKENCMIAIKLLQSLGGKGKDALPELEKLRNDPTFGKDAAAAIAAIQAGK